MLAEVISIGDELTSGQRLDTNSRWLSRQLGELGVRTVRHSTVCDDLAANMEAFQQAVKRVDVVVCTGGLGPTLDDLTRQAMAEAFGLKLVLDEDSLEHIRNMFRSRNREMPERNRMQAMFPEDALVIPNPHGSAPGIDLQVVDGERTCRIFALPGVPAEMFQMWHESVATRIESMQANPLGKLRFHSLKVFGIGESDVEVKLPELIGRERVPTVGITVSRATITLRIAGRSDSQEQFEQLIAPTVAEIQAALGDLVFGEGEEELQHVVLRELERQNTTLATVEIGASSLIGDWMLHAGEAAAKRFRGSLAFPSYEAALEWLTQSSTGTDTSQLDLDALSQEAARLARQRFDCDYVLVVGRYPSQSEMDFAEEPFEFRWVVAHLRGGASESGKASAQSNDRATVELLSASMGGHPDVLPPRVAKTGLDFLRRILQKIDQE